MLRDEDEASAMTQLSTDELANLIAKRHACLVQLRDLGKRQSELIASGEIGTLLRLLAAKNQLLVAVQTIESGLTPFHAQDPEQRNWPSKEARARCTDQAAECRQLLDEIMYMERQNEQEMTTRRDQVANQLQAAQAASKVRGAYQAQQIASLPCSQSTETAATTYEQHAAPTNRLDIHSDTSTP